MPLIEKRCIEGEAVGILKKPDGRTEYLLKRFSVRDRTVDDMHLTRAPVGSEEATKEGQCCAEGEVDVCLKAAAQPLTDAICQPHQPILYGFDRNIGTLLIAAKMLVEAFDRGTQGRFVGGEQPHRTQVARLHPEAEFQRKERIAGLQAA